MTSELAPGFRVAYLGPAGTYSHAAVLKYFGKNQDCHPVAEIPDIFKSVESGECRYGLVPVENSSEGSITLTLDIISQSKLHVCGEVMLRIQHMLMVNSKNSAEKVTRIVSHQQSLGQCRDWLDQHYPDVERVSVSSNAEAAKIAQRESGVAAIAGKTAAELYNLHIVAEDIEDSHDNTTRFWIISRDGKTVATGHDKTSLVISTRNEPGTLFAALAPFKNFGVNLSKLESRPSRKEAWSYSFYVDVDGHIDDAKIKAALNELKMKVFDIKVLGSYPVAGKVHKEKASRLMHKELAGKKIVIVGLGLIGGSLAKALAEKGLGPQLWASGRNQEAIQKALHSEVIGGYSQDLAECCKDADIVLLAVPGLSVRKIFQELAPVLQKHTIVTDVASVKSSIIDAAREVFGKVPANFVPAHPIAGSEQSGFKAAQADLFTGKKVIITPEPHTAPEAIKLIKALWEEAGAEVLQMNAEQHDEVLAATSHLPHLLAYTLVDTLSQQGQREDIFRYAAGGFRDFTRIASSDPEMWRDIFLGNGEANIRILDQFCADLSGLRKAIQEGDGNYLFNTFRRAKQSRDKFMHINNDNENQNTNMSTGENGKLTYKLNPGGSLKGEFRVPGDKSISHRSIILGSIAEGQTTVEGFLEGEDSLATVAAFRAMGVNIEGPENGKVLIHGVGLHGLKQPAEPLYLGNSGTSMRLLTGLLAPQDFPTTLTGDESLSKRPMKRISEPLATMGAKIHLQEGGLAPIEIEPAKLQPINYVMPVASAQVKSCLLLASLYVEGETVITEPAPCRDHTERMLAGFGWPIVIDGPRVSISGGGTLQGCHIDVPADISSAAFFLVGASIAPGSDITLRHVGINPTRTGVINILRAMGADITYLKEYEAGGELAADIRIKYAPLKGITIPEDQVPLAIDEFPALFIAAACAKGKTILSGAEELRVKESDRIQAMADGLAVLGVSHQVTADGIIIEGSELHGGVIDSLGDHRIAMAFAMAALRASSPITILDCDNVATSFPGFAELTRSQGLDLTESREA